MKFVFCGFLIKKTANFNGDFEKKKNGDFWKKEEYFSRKKNTGGLGKF